MNRPALKVRDLVLAVHPTTRGFGWVLFQGPLAPLDWGTARVGGDHARSIARIQGLINRFGPTELVLEQFEGEPARRGGRVRRLGQAIVRLAQTQGLEVRIFSREAIELAFRPLGAKTRHDIAAAIAARIDAFAHLLPRNRKVWDSESPRMGLFNAAALGITRFIAIDGLSLPM